MGNELMRANREGELCRYYYDPLDRLVGASPTSDNKHLRFYCKDRLATELQGAVQHSIFQQNEQLFAQQNRQGDAVETSLLATDEMRSVLKTVGAHPSQQIVYSPYGHRHPENGLLSLLGFNGERADLITGHYLLGNGYRAYNSVLMRFNSPDNISPFGKGGLNPYMYCSGDPVNLSDSSGHVGVWNLVNSIFRRTSKSTKYTLVGFHGNDKKENIESLLKNGPDLSRLGTGDGTNALGEGFYVAETYGEAKIYAGDYRNKSADFFLSDHRRRMPEPSDRVLSVYVKKMDKNKFDKNHSTLGGHTVLRPKIFKSIIFQRTTDNGVRVPLERNIKIRNP